MTWNRWKSQAGRADGQLSGRSRRASPDCCRLQVTYRAAPPSSLVPQLNLYDSYKSRFDPYTAATPLLGGQELIQLVCATFPGCEMAKDDDDYVLKGLKERDGPSERDPWERGVEGVVEPLRAGSW